MSAYASARLRLARWLDERIARLFNWLASWRLL